MGRICLLDLNYTLVGNQMETRLLRPFSRLHIPERNNHAHGDFEPSHRSIRATLPELRASFINQVESCTLRPLGI